jgi:N-acetylmuramate 1-kinase
MRSCQVGRKGTTMDDQLLAQACQLLATGKEAWPPREVRVQPLQPDGSSRRFHRLVWRQESVLAVQPSANDAAGLREARAAALIGRHLQGRGCPVAGILGYDRQSGLLLMEDLGDLRLYELVCDQGWSRQVVACYREVVAALARLQVLGAEGFATQWCWDTPTYDRQLMRTRESDYFARAFCVDLLGLAVTDAVEAEFDHLADAAAAVAGGFFLHRDCQSRNVMVKAGQVRFIDIQGGRLGPLAYDLASLLIDPYVRMPESVQTELIQVYLEALDRYLSYDHDCFVDEYLLLALQRNLQILGAFAYLSKQRHKPFFRQFLGPALESLLSLLAKPECAGYAALNQMARQCQAAMTDQP